MARTGWRGTVIGEAFSEFLGTFVLVAFGDGVVAMAVAALNQSGRGDVPFAAAGDWLLITWGWALAVAFGVYVSGGISGGHINPAVTLALAVKRDFPWKKVPTYMVAQILGAFVAAALVLLVYGDAIASFEAANNIERGALGGEADSTATFSIFATFPAPYFDSLIGPFIDQVVGTAFLVLFVAALLDNRNVAPLSNLAPLLVGLAVGAIGMSFGANAGYAINPARDFGPRLIAYFAGWGDVAFPGAMGYWWVPILGPLVGGVVGVFIYDWFIGDIITARQVPPTPGTEPHGRTVVETREGEEPEADAARGRSNPGPDEDEERREP